MATPVAAAHPAAASPSSSALRSRLARLCLAAATVGTVAAAPSTVLASDGPPAMGAVYYHFGEYDAARVLYARLAAGAAYPVPWLDNLAAVELASGDVELGRRYAARAVTLERARRPGHAYRRGQLALLALLGRQVLLGRRLGCASQSQPHDHRHEQRAHRARGSRSARSGLFAD